MKKFLKKSMAMLMAAIMLSAGTAVFADGEESGDTTESTALYSTHVWRTFETVDKEDVLNEDPATSNNTPFNQISKSKDATVDNNISGKYGAGIKVSNRALDNTYRPDLRVRLNNPITLDSAIENGTKVEISFDYYGTFPQQRDNFLYLSSAESTSGKFATIRIKNDGELAVMNSAGTVATTLKTGKQEELAEFHNFKMVISAEEDATAGTKSWVLDSFYYDGADTGKYVAGTVIGSGEFTHMVFYFKTEADQSGFLCLDNISVTSYTGSTSPIPNRYTYMDTVLGYKNLVDAYNNETITEEYNNALGLFEKEYVLQTGFDTTLNTLKSSFPQTVVSYDFDTLAEAKSAVRNSSRFIYDETTLSNEYGYGNALYWDYDYNNDVGQRGNAMEFKTGISAFDAVPANTYVETSFDVKYNLNDSDRLKLSMLNPDREAFTAFYVSDSDICANHRGTYSAAASENEMLRVKITLQITDENGDMVNKITGLSVNGNKVSDTINVDKPDKATGYAFMGIELNAADNTVLNEVWIDNFSVVTYTSADGASLTGDKYMLAQKLEQLSALMQNNAVDAAVKTTIETEVPEIVAVFSDPTLPQSSIDEAVAAADAIIVQVIGESNDMFEITGINFVVGDGEESNVLTDGAKVSSVDITDKNIKDVDAHLVIASYSNNGTTLYSAEIVEIKNTAFAANNKIDVELALPLSAADTKVKAFVFSSLEGIAPIAESYTHPE